MCPVVFLDIHQAFDRLCQQRLLYKLDTPSQKYLLLKLYITDCHFEVIIDNIHSVYFSLKSGLPQGSKLETFSVVT